MAGRGLRLLVSSTTKTSLFGVEEQVAALRAGDAAALDIANLIEELEGLTKRDERALGSQLKRIMAHVLKQRHQPKRASRSWEDSISNAREEIADILEQSPSLRRLLPNLMTKNYPRAVAKAARDTRLPEESFPTRPPFSLGEVLGNGC
jgi:predicted  nucleic acid-binding Zn-ribbon protein